MKQQAGITLIELMVMTGIIAILVSIGLMIYADMKESTLKARLHHYVDTLHTAVHFAHLHWHLEDKPESILLHGQTIYMSEQGYPRATKMPTDSAVTSEQCAALWNNLLTANDTVYPLNYETPEVEECKFQEDKVLNCQIYSTVSSQMDNTGCKFFLVHDEQGLQEHVNYDTTTGVIQCLIDIATDEPCAEL